MTSAQTLILIFALIAANLPFMTRRILFIGPIASSADARKPLVWCLIELVSLYLLTGALAAWFESSNHGGIYQQGWQFYAITACLFVVFAYPGFVARYLWHRRRS